MEIALVFCGAFNMRPWWGRVPKIFKWAAGIFLILVTVHFLEELIFILSLAQMLYQRGLMDASAKNARGDVASAETDVFGAPERLMTTLIRLHRAGDWFSTTLIDVRSFDFLVGLKWRNDDTLDLQLDFGCEPQMDPPITRVGPIHIVYHWGDPGYIPKGGYAGDPPPEPCPATGARHTGRYGERAFTGPTLIPTP
jgi:hypothetical protein